MTTTIGVGSRWQDVLEHRVELGDAPSGDTGNGVWGTSRWGAGLWGEGWSPVFRDITVDLLAAHVVAGTVSLEDAAGVGTVELTLLDLEGSYSPTGPTDTGWLLGRHVRGWATPTGAPETPLFYGIIDKVSAGGTFAVPTVVVTAYDVRSLIAAAPVASPIADQAETASTRLTNVLDAAGIPRAAQVVAPDTTSLTADDSTQLGDIFDRTVESAAGLAYGDAAGRVVTWGRDWVAGTADHVSLYVYAGDPPSPTPGIPIAQTTGDLDATEAIDTIANVVTFTNRKPGNPDTVTRTDPDSVGRYGYRTVSVSDLCCDADLLAVLADRALALHKSPTLVCEGGTVSVYDQATAQAAGLQLGAMVVVGRNDPGIATWELLGVVTGLEVTIDPDRFEVSVTVVNTGTLRSAAALWDSGRWDLDRWQAAPVTPPITTIWTLGSGPAACLDQNVLG